MESKYDKKTVYKTFATTRIAKDRKLNLTFRCHSLPLYTRKSYTKQNASKDFGILIHRLVRVLTHFKQLLVLLRCKIRMEVPDWVDLFAVFDHFIVQVRPC